MLQDNIQTTNETLFSKLLAKYIPYWPMFLVLGILSFGVALAYIKITPKKYQSTASLIIKDEKKGNDDSRIMESLNLMGSKKIIENEIIFLHFFFYIPISNICSYKFYLLRFKKFF